MSHIFRLHKQGSAINIDALTWLRLHILRFLERASEIRTALGNTCDAIPAMLPIHGFRHDVEPDDFIALLVALPRDISGCGR